MILYLLLKNILFLVNKYFFIKKIDVYNFILTKLSKLCPSKQI